MVSPAMWARRSQRSRRNAGGKDKRCVLDALYICEPFRERSKIGGSLLSSEGPAFEVYIDAAPCPRACFYAFSLSAQPKLRRADSHN